VHPQKRRKHKTLECCKNTKTTFNNHQKTPKQHKKHQINFRKQQKQRKNFLKNQNDIKEQPNNIKTAKYHQ
jgi:hypothetical protein